MQSIIWSAAILPPLKHPHSRPPHQSITGQCPLKSFIIAKNFTFCLRPQNMNFIGCNCSGKRKLHLHASRHCDWDDQDNKLLSLFPMSSLIHPCFFLLCYTKESCLTGCLKINPQGCLELIPLLITNLPNV